jgi:GNAT superfamily N-acetyltransferase
MEAGTYIHLLRGEHLPRVLELTALAGWNQTLADLERMLSIAPESAFGLWRGEELVSTAMAFSYGEELGWIAMVLTHPDARGRGYASRLTARAVEWLRGRGTRWMKLDASHLGQPVYERMGFVMESRMERYLRPGEVAAPGEWDAGLSQPPESAEIPLALDRAAFGADRGHLLHLLLRVPGVRVAVVPDGGGYAMLRPGAKAVQLGPMVCRDLAAARQLLHWALHASDGSPVQWDIHTGNEGALGLASAHGFTVQRVLARMVLPGTGAVEGTGVVEGTGAVEGDAGFRGLGQAAPPQPQGNQVYAIAGFDFG